MIVSFDIETTLKYHDFLCGAIAYRNEGEIEVEYFWFGESSGAHEMIERLLEMQSYGATIVGFNSTSFDYRILAKETGMYEQAEIAALNSVDIMLEFFFRNGYMISLDKILSRYNITQKKKTATTSTGRVVDVGGAEVNQLWDEKEYNTVIEYLKNDVVSTLELIENIIADDMILYSTSSGKQKELPLNGGIRTVRNLWKIPKPSVSWIKNPVSREHFFDWMSITTDVTISGKWYWSNSPENNKIVWGKFRNKREIYVWPVYIQDGVWYDVNNSVLAEEPLAWMYTSNGGPRLA